jgi:hypothetical protein
MSWKPVIWLLAAVILTALFIAVFERGGSPAGLAVRMDEPLLGFEPQNVTRLAVSVSNFQAECVLRSGRWYVSRPVETRANDARIRQVVDALHRLRRRETIPPHVQKERRLTAASFGLDRPRCRCALGYERGEDTVVLGMDAPFGNLVYVRVNDGGDVIAATRELEGALPGSLDELRDRAVFPAAVRKASRLEIKHAGGFVQLAQAGGVWRIRQPYDAPAARDRVTRLLETLAALQMDAHGGDLPAADPVAYGLGPDEAALLVSVWVEGQAEPLTLSVGKARQDNPALVYARVSDVAAVGAISNAVIALLTAKADTLRDRRLCQADPALMAAITVEDGVRKVTLERAGAAGWMLTEPVRSRADALAVGTLLRNLCAFQADPAPAELASNLAERVVREMDLKVTLAETNMAHAVLTNGAVAVAETAGRRWTYLAGARTGGQQFVLREEDRAVFVGLSSEWVRVFPRGDGAGTDGGLDPLQYMDRGVLGVDVDHVRRITLAKGGREETLVKDAAGNWSVDSPPGARMAEGAVAGLPGIGAELQALRIESLSCTNAARYGMNESSPRLTLGLTGTAGIQKTILLGGGDGRDGVYAMVQGLDTVFVLQKTVAEALTRNLTVAP